MSDPDNENIVNVVTSITPHLLGQVTELKDNVLLDSGPELSCGKLLNTANMVLGFWILSYHKANNAKYLVGVSTKTKDCVGIFRLNKSAIRDENGGPRIYFRVNLGLGLGKPSEEKLHEKAKLEKATDLVYLKGITKEKENTEIPRLPYLSLWTAQNPVLYYKRFVSSREDVPTFDDDTKIKIMQLLGMKDARAVDYDNLSDTDIVVVRTYKFDN